MQIRLASLNDAPFVAPLIYSSGPELYDFIYKTGRVDPKQFIEFEFRSGRGFCGYRNVTVVMQGDEVVATGCFFDGNQHKSLSLGSLVNMFLFFGPLEGWSVLARSLHIKSVMKRPRGGELYLSNLGVSPACRGRGIGAALMQSKVNEAKSRGYTRFGLDVAITNPRAENLYQRLGLKFVKQKRFSGLREPYVVPDSKKMELDLTEIENNK